jgi:ParB family transcriptional regulator, chromosome partitioning protein
MSKIISSNSPLSGIIDDIDIHKIRHPKHQLRSTDHNIAALATSIRRKGLLQPIVVRMLKDNYEIVAGNRRYEACKMLRWRKITCHIKELDDKDAFEISLIENIHRKTLNPIEEAKAFKAYVSEFGWGGITELALKLGKSASFVTKRIALLRLPPEIIESISKFTLSSSVAEELYFVKDTSKQSQLAQIISHRHLTLRKVRQMVRSMDDDQEARNTFVLNRSNNEDDLEQVQRCLDKSTIVLKIALNRLDQIINDSAGYPWIIQEILLHNRHVLHKQIDILLKEKKKTRSNLIRLPKC